ncbi:hypothetical protein [Desulfolutivibrio sp.]|uniref:hypothetical protein n=1 Tax=Desulfolutivibrio sp. TaxID=2773296 RepID=UPI002F96A367
MDIQCRSGMRIVLAAVAAMAVGLFSGCAPIASPPPPVTASPPVAPQSREETPRPAEDPGYLDAVSAFQSGDMERAASLFEQVSQAALDEPSRRRALYGLACARLTMAQDEKELAKARSLWETWRAESPPGGDGEDPKFMAGILSQYRPAFLVKDIKAACDKECDKRLLEKEEEVRRIIQRQVQALEEIHREIQEKKKGLSNY